MAHLRYCCSQQQRGCVPMGLLVSVLLVSSMFHEVNCQLKINFYGKMCPMAESLVEDSVSFAIFNDRSVAGSLLRLLFHDCFTQGCDASLLLDSVSGHQAEKDAPPNKSLRGFDVIDSAKTRVESVCPGVVSCADILAFAARDSVVQMGGQRWTVPSGRRDGLSSNASDANSNLPSFSSNVVQLAQRFQAKGFTPSEMVTLSGAHTLGGAACSSFTDRLYNFNSSVGQDPSLDSQYAQTLKTTCPNGRSPSNNRATVSLDLSTPNVFDNRFYQNLMTGKGLLQTDQLLSIDPKTRGNVRQLASNNSVFLSKFAKAMVKLSGTGVKTGSQGQIRLNCRVINS